MACSKACRHASRWTRGGCSSASGLHRDANKASERQDGEFSRRPDTCPVEPRQISSGILGVARRFPSSLRVLRSWQSWRAMRRSAPGNAEHQTTFRLLPCPPRVEAPRAAKLLRTNLPTGPSCACVSTCVPPNFLVSNRDAACRSHDGSRGLEAEIVGPCVPPRPRGRPALPRAAGLARAVTTCVLSDVHWCPSMRREARPLHTGRYVAQYQVVRYSVVLVCGPFSYRMPQVTLGARAAARGDVTRLDTGMPVESLHEARAAPRANARALARSSD